MASTHSKNNPARSPLSSAPKTYSSAKRARGAAAARRRSTKSYTALEDAGDDLVDDFSTSFDDEQSEASTDRDDFSYTSEARSTGGRVIGPYSKKLIAIRLPVKVVEQLARNSKAMRITQTELLERLITPALELLTLRGKR